MIKNTASSLQVSRLSFKAAGLLLCASVALNVSTRVNAQTAVTASSAVATDAKPSSKAIEAAPTWKALTPAQQQALKPMQDDWAGLDSNRKKKWLAVAQRYQTLSAPEQARMHEKMGQWSKLSPAQRSAARDNYSVVLSSPNTQSTGTDTPDSGAAPKSNLSEQWAKYQALPSEKKASLAEQANKAADTSKTKPLAP